MIVAGDARKGDGMCGIMGYVGHQSVVPILLGGLGCLEYRGYDSAGIALEQGADIVRYRSQGKLSQLKALLPDPPPFTTCGIGHTRWATHGSPTEVNAHPHMSVDGRIAVVHNGTIENFEELRAELEAEGYRFSSETDTEVLPHLIHRALRQGAESLAAAVERALECVRGAYGIAVLSADHPGEIVVASVSSPIVVGMGDGELFLASDESALAGHVRSVLRLGDGEIITLREGGIFLFRGSHAEIEDRLEDISTSVESAHHDGYTHMMLKEIHEQPEALANTLRGRLMASEGIIQLGGIVSHIERLATSRRIILVACGSAYYASLAGKLFFERLAGIPVEVAHASEFQYGDTPIGFQDVVIGVSQSGETADTIGAIRFAKKQGALCLGVTNKPGTLLPRITDGGVFLQAGPEHAVASTKAFSAQIIVLLLMALRVAMARGTRAERVRSLMPHVAAVPALLEDVLKKEEQVRQIAREYQHAVRVMFIGRRFAVPLSFEAALKVAEVGYIDAFGYPAGELKHGPIALIKEGVPVFALALASDVQDKMLSNMQEVAARGAHVIAVVTAGDTRANGIARHVIEVPDIPEELTAVVCAPLFQLLSYYLGVLRGNDVDHPRNLAKAVTVE